MPDPNPILQSENPGKAALVAARASAKPEPRTWSLPAEPGPEVKAVRCQPGHPRLSYTQPCCVRRLRSFCRVV